jgi:myosin heavy subunit
MRRLTALAGPLASSLHLLASEDDTSPSADADLHALWASLSHFGLTPGSPDARELLQALAAVRALARLQFSSVEGGDGTEPAVVKAGSLEEVAGLLGVTPQALHLCLCQRRIMARNHRSVHESNLSVPLAEMCRDVLAKEVFEAAFWWMVSRINARAPQASGRCVGL